MIELRCGAKNVDFLNEKVELRKMYPGRNYSRKEMISISDIVAGIL